MTQQTNPRSEQVFSKLPDYGYSNKVATAIWRWYHPSKKVIATY